MIKKTERELIIQLQVKDQNEKIYNLEKTETFNIEWEKETSKTVVFNLGEREHKFVISIKPKKGWFGDRVWAAGVSQGKFMPQQKPVEIIGETKIIFKNNQWNTEGKILVGSLISLIVIGIIAFIVWRKRKKVKSN
ncbi:hypothetical protein [endosymbiont GvMRE of Glomus versiforme]|uniref:hypothetical protein n=1 Tax=endosymbiont GvMRE of Glomus versiforme TaxID=2039283 RepID=UPI0011C39A55|nr:hypothetical protein [endosymbiont GvMRE of Glomus versiforme]